MKQYSRLWSYKSKQLSLVDSQVYMLEQSINEMSMMITTALRMV